MAKSTCRTEHVRWQEMGVEDWMRTRTRMQDVDVPYLIMKESTYLGIWSCSFHPFPQGTATTNKEAPAKISTLRAYLVNTTGCRNITYRLMLQDFVSWT